jgi:hypothetical protein
MRFLHVRDDVIECHERVCFYRDLIHQLRYIFHYFSATRLTRCDPVATVPRPSTPSRSVSFYNPSSASLPSSAAIAAAAAATTTRESIDVAVWTLLQMTSKAVSDEARTDAFHIGPPTDWDQPRVADKCVCGTPRRPSGRQSINKLQAKRPPTEYREAMSALGAARRIPDMPGFHPIESTTLVVCLAIHMCSNDRFPFYSRPTPQDERRPMCDRQHATFNGLPRDQSGLT